MKINLGSHNKNIGDEYVNVDALELPNVDAICDLTKFPFVMRVKNIDKFKEGFEGVEKDMLVDIPSNFVEEIIFHEVLEHISFRYTISVLKEIYRILKIGGKLDLQVPDCGKSMEYYVNEEICECVKHKPTCDEEARGNPNCSKCHGKAKIHPLRWAFSFTGAQKHFPHDVHKTFFVKEGLEKALRSAGFTDIKYKEDKYGWKLKYNCYK